MTVRLRLGQTDAETASERLERKFYLAPARVGFALGLLRQRLAADACYPLEQVNSLYFDTIALEQYRRSQDGDYAKDKVRIRWYQVEGMQNGALRRVFVELKSRRGFSSTKRRLELEVSAEALRPDRLRRGIVSSTMLADIMAGFGYVSPGMLLPVIHISYWRYRFQEPLEGCRVMLDRRIRSTMIRPGIGDERDNLELPGGIIELKGVQLSLPVSVRSLRLLDVDWTRFSKYASCIDAHRDEPGTVGYLWPAGRLAGL